MAELLTPEELTEIRDRHDAELRYRNGEPASMQSHTSLCYADKDRQHLLNHTTALEADNAEYHKMLLNPLGTIIPLETALEAAEQHIKILTDPDNKCSNMYLASKLDKAEATITRIEGLIEALPKRVACPYCDSVTICANELKQALRENDDE